MPTDTQLICKKVNKYCLDDDPAIQKQQEQTVKSEEVTTSAPAPTQEEKSSFTTEPKPDGQLKKVSQGYERHTYIKVVP